jgi:excinuclease ABC subunit C
VGRVSAAEHRRIVEDFCDFMAGKTDAMIKRLQRQMAEASAQLEFERAARLRDDLDALRRALEKQAVVFADGTDADVVAFAQDDLEAAVQVFHVRGGRVRGERGWTIDKAATVDGTSGVPELVEQFVTQFYGSSGDADGAEGGGMDGAGIPREILVPELPANAGVLVEWLSVQRGSRVSLRVPQRGDKRALMETVARNAAQAFAQHKLRRASDLTARSQALSELQDALGLAEAPLRIECFDVSHVQGTNVVASMVVFEDGLPRKSEYRRFAMRTGGGDTDWIAEAVRRRFARYLDAQVAVGALDAAAPDAEAAARGGIDPETGRPRKFAYPPNLVVVDGGAPQVAAAQAVLDDLGVDDVALIGLAKRLEEVWLPREPYPVILPRSSEGLYLLQRVRDEAHRFAITFHRQRRSKAMTISVLDGIPGLGDTRRKALVARFGSLKRLRTASMADLLAVPGIGPQTAEAIQAALAADRRSREPAVNVTTGEVLEIEEADDTGDGSG